MELFRSNLLEATSDLLKSLQNTAQDTTNNSFCSTNNSFCSTDASLYKHHIVPECYNCVLFEAQCSILQAKVLLLEAKVETLSNLLDTSLIEQLDTGCDVITDEVMIYSNSYHESNCGSDFSSDIPLIEIVERNNVISPDPCKNNHPDYTDTYSHITEISGNEITYDNISDDTLLCSSTNGTIGSTDSESEAPFNKVLGAPFCLFDHNELQRSTVFTHHFSNRLASYYGEYAYSYGDITHAPCEFTDNPYLMKLCSYLSVVVPHFLFNSALINMYRDGNDFMPAHGDYEDCIVSGSEIGTISLGTDRVMEFTDKSGQLMSSTKLDHGDLIFMSQSSQSEYSHAILRDENNNLGRTFHNHVCYT